MALGVHNRNKYHIISYATHCTTHCTGRHVSFFPITAFNTQEHHHQTIITLWINTMFVYCKKPNNSLQQDLFFRHQQWVNPDSAVVLNCIITAVKRFCLRIWLKINLSINTCTLYMLNRQSFMRGRRKITADVEWEFLLKLVRRGLSKVWNNC